VKTNYIDLEYFEKNDDLLGNESIEKNVQIVKKYECTIKNEIL
jgi:hypothetical protein